MTADDLRCLDEAGYLVLPAHLAVSREILSHLETLFEQAGENAGHALRVEAFTRTVDLVLPPMDPGASGLFAPLTEDLTVLGCVEHLLGREYELAALHARSSNPFALALDRLRPGPGERACQVLWLLDDFTEAGTAALRVVSGSQLLDSPRARFAESPPAASVPGPAGSVVILHGRLWSGDAANPGNRHLRTMRCDYVRRASQE
jgi:hypothetical protein